MRDVQKNNMSKAPERKVKVTMLIFISADICSRFNSSVTADVNFVNTEADSPPWLKHLWGKTDKSGQQSEILYICTSILH